jgi:IclR family KDG regulon transcriptional repressor
MPADAVPAALRALKEAQQEIQTLLQRIQ